MADHAEKTSVSHRVNVNRLPAKGVTVTLEGDDEQRAALARAHGLLSVERFSAELAVRPWKADGVMVKGRVKADITQECIVTLAPLPAKIDEEVSAVFVPEESRLARIGSESGEILVDAEGEDLPEPFAGDTIDVGALAEEFFELAIDPYPRKAGTALDLPSSEDPEEKGAGPLYEGLKKLKGSG